MPPPPHRPVQEDELHGFVDGRLDPARHAEIARLIAADPGVAARVADWQRQNARLHEALGPLARAPVPPALHVGRLLEQHMRRTAPWRVAAAFALCTMAAGAMGAAGGWTLRGPQRTSDIDWLTRQATSAHRVFAEHDTAPGAADRTTLAAWMGDQLAPGLGVPDLGRLGYHFVAGRMLAAVGGPAAMLLYDDRAGTRITVYVQPMAHAETIHMREVQTDAVDGYAWIEDRIGYSVLTGAPTAGLHGLADRIRDAIHAS